MGVGGQHHAPAALPPGKTQYPLYRRLGRPQGRSGQVRKISSPAGFDPRTVQLVASRYTDCLHTYAGMNKFCINVLNLQTNEDPLMSIHRALHLLDNESCWITKAAVSYVMYKNINNLNVLPV